MSRHKLIAIFMAPFLAVGGFIGAGYFSGDNEEPMLVLTAEHGCWLTAARCQLNSAGIELKLKTNQQLTATTSVTIELESSVALDDILISVAEKNQKSQPQRMKKQDDSHWSVQAQMPETVDPEKLTVRLVVGWQGKIYFADESIK